MRVNFCIIEMKAIAYAATCFFLFASNSSPSYAYPHIEMKACMASALNAVVLKGLKADYFQVKRYCDCSLRRITDEGSDINTSLAYCNKRYFF